MTEHPDVEAPELCYLAAGEKEKTLLAHNYLYGWETGAQWPLLDLIRDEPRFQAAMVERNRKIAVQCQTIELGKSLDR
ncbi:MAG: hypothetical protein HKO88_14605 [Xanthomonadales bacterium]|nr:hypothetical protein [Xanthomonadales bacterium]